MNLKILKKDLKRKKSMNLILLLFVMLATTFIAASVNNLKVVTNGVDYFFEKAGLPDFVINPMSGINGEKTENDRKIENFLEEQENVTEYYMDNNLTITENMIEEIGDTDFDISNTLSLSSVECQQKFFDENNQEITEIEEGDIYFPKKVLDGKLNVGDSFYIVSGNYKKKFTVKGVVKDALFGSQMMGMVRIVVSQEDYEELMQNGEFISQKLYSVFCNDVDRFEQDYNDCGFNVLFGEGSETVRMTYVMDMIIAAILLVVSVCLIIIAAIMLRFTIIFTVNEDYKEIGIMKAIGLPDMSIRSLYVTKYLVISAIGAIFGFFLSVPFSQMLVAEVTKNIVVEESTSNLLMSAVISVLVVVIIVFFAFMSTGRIKKLTPMDAIRNGNNGERFERKTILSLGKSGMRPSTFMALNDVLCELKKYIILLITSAVGVWLVVMPINTINTLRSEKVAAWFGYAPCDFYVSEQGKIEEIVLSGERSEYEKYLADLKERLLDENIPVDHVATEVVYRFKIKKGEYSFNSIATQGLGNSTDQYMYEEGTPPIEDNEIAITHIVAEKIQAEIGDTVYVSMFEKEIPFVVTAIYQSMNNMGEGLRFAENTEIDSSALAGAAGTQVILEETTDKEELNHMIEKLNKAFPDAEVETVQEYVDGMSGGIAATIEPVKSLILTVVIIINILVVVLMQKMFLIREQGEMGMLKAIGFSNHSIISWQTKRIALILSVGVLLGTITGTFFTELTSGQIFKYMGCSRIEFQINPWEVYVLYPVAIYVTTIIVCMITMLKVRKISVQNMSDE